VYIVSLKKAGEQSSPLRNIIIIPSKNNGRLCCGVARHLKERTKTMTNKPAQSLLFVALSALLGVGCGGKLPENTFIDKRDGTTYKVIQIGYQRWFAENLNYAGSNGDVGRYYDDDPANGKKYGRLYTFDEAIKVCPAGWWLPDTYDWTELENTVGGWETAGKKLKSKKGWYENGNGTDVYSFSALPGGFCFSDGSFNNVGSDAHWWSATEYAADTAWYRYMSFMREGVYSGNDDKAYLFSVRCVKGHKANGVANKTNLSLVFVALAALLGVGFAFFVWAKVNKTFLKLAVVRGWKENILPVLMVISFSCMILAAGGRNGALASVGFLMITLAGTISSIILLPKKYLAVISQLLIQLIIVFLGILYYIFIMANPNIDRFNKYVEAVLFVIVPNILSVLIVVCIKCIYFNVFRKRSRKLKITFVIFSLIGFGVFLFLLVVLVIGASGI